MLQNYNETSEFVQTTKDYASETIDKEQYLLAIKKTMNEGRPKPLDLYLALIYSDMKDLEDVNGNKDMLLQSLEQVFT